MLIIFRGLKVSLRRSSTPMGRDYEQVRQDLASNMKDRRGKLGLSQESLALSADVDRTYVSQIERAVGNPSLLVLCKLGVILGMDVIDMFSSAQPSHDRSGSPDLS